LISTPEPEEKPSNVVNLMDALHRSVAGDRRHGARGHAGKQAVRRRKKAA
jgi:non-homologous end joining protein Ku